MKIIVDDREHDLMSCFNDLLKINVTNPFEIVKQTLHIGDVILTPGSLDGDEYCIIERKSLSDLLSSIKDGRYEEQSHRLSYSTTCPNHRIIYIIEGNMNTLKNPSEYKMVCSAITSLNMYKGFSVLKTTSVQETARLIFHMMEKIIKNNSKKQSFYGSLSDTSGNKINIQNVDPPVNYCNLVKKVKKDNINPDNIGEIMLSQIPGVSSITAIAIMSNFKSFYNLIECLQKDCTCLENLTITKNEKTRKISKKALEDIKTYLLHNPMNDTA
jgi:crossover junction endonuclease MUS81